MLCNYKIFHIHFLTNLKKKNKDLAINAYLIKFVFHRLYQNLNWKFLLKVGYQRTSYMFVSKSSCQIFKKMELANFISSEIEYY